MRHVIRLGDPTSHDGAVVSAASNYSMMGKNVARVGDRCTCPKKGHNNCTIAEGDPNWTIDGRAVALEGHKTTCGAVLISTCAEVGRSYEGDGAASLSNGFAGAASYTPATNLVSDEHEFDRFFKVVDQDGAPLGELEAVLAAPNGQTTEIQTANDGTTPLVSGYAGERAEFSLAYGQKL